MAFCRSSGSFIHSLCSASWWSASHPAIFAISRASPAVTRAPSLYPTQRRQARQLALGQVVVAEREVGLFARRRLAIERLAQALVEVIEQAAMPGDFDLEVAGRNLVGAMPLGPRVVRGDLGLVVGQFEHG